MCLGVEIPWYLEDLGIVVEGMVNESLSELLDFPARRSGAVIPVEESRKLLIVR